MVIMVLYWCNTVLSHAKVWPDKPCGRPYAVCRSSVSVLALHRAVECVTLHLSCDSFILSCLWLLLFF